jgi:hypothetical protein
VRNRRIRVLGVLFCGMLALTLLGCGGSSHPAGTAGPADGVPTGSSADPLAVLKATKYIYFDASAFKVPGQAGGVFVTFHEPAEVAWNGLRFSSSPSWTYTTAGQNAAEKAVDQKITLSGEMAADGKSIKSLTLTETYTVKTADLGTRVTHLEFADITNTSFSNDAGTGRTWVAISKLPAAKSLLVGGTYSFPSGGTQAVTWEGGNQGISIGFSEKPQAFALLP